MDKLKAMQTFVRIADEGSLTAAARAEGSSLPAVVRQLAAYEAALGVRLFNRTTRRISLTDEGRLHLGRTRQILAAVEEAEDALTAESRAPAGHLTITAPVLFGQMHVAPCVMRFLAAHDKIRCSVLLLDRNVDLLEEGIDVGIRIGELKDSSLVAVPLGRIRRVVVAHPSYLRSFGTPTHPRDLERANCIRVAGGPPAWGDFQGGLRVRVSGNLEFNHVLPAVQACAAGMGFGMFFSYQVEPMLKAKRLRIVLEEFEKAPRPIQLVYPHARLLPARSRAFVDWVVKDLIAFR